MSSAYPKHASYQPKVLTGKEVQAELTKAVKSATATRKPYEKHAVVFIHFADDDIGCDGPEKEMAAIFREFYGIYNIKHILLNNKANPTLVIQEALVNLAKNGNANLNCLVIIVFSGHGKLEEKKPFVKHKGKEYTLLLG